MIIKNLLHQPLVINLKGKKNAFHLGPRKNTQIKEVNISNEIKSLQGKGYISLREEKVKSKNVKFVKKTRRIIT